jgi:hypothetical protein
MADRLFRLRTRPSLRGLLAAALILAAPGSARAEYRTIETEDMRLVYPGAALSFIAPYSARCFENSLRFHRSLFHYQPSEKVNVILDDFTDYGNAGVWVSPRNSLVVHIAPCNFVYETGPSNERMSFTMNHEVVHVVALDQDAGSDRLFRGLFRGKVRETADHPETILYGYLTLPRRAAPRWYHEGIAVFLETRMAGGLGRAQGPYDEMVFRSMVRDSSHFYDPLGLESEGTKVDFQVGVNSYLYGTRFMSYLAERYGPESLVQWVSRSPGSRAYFASQFRKVYGLPLNHAWQDWVGWEHGFQRANLDSIRRYPTTPYHDLSRTPLGSVSRAFFDSTSRVLYAGLNYPGTVAHIAAIPLDGGPIRKLHEVKGPALYFVSALAFDPDTRTLFYSADNNGWRDLCALDPRTGRSRTLIRNGRIGDLAFDRKDRSLWGVRHFNGISTVVRLRPPYKDWNQIVSLPYGRDLYDLDISPDGASMVASMAEISGRQSLRLLKLSTLVRGDTTSRTLYDFGNSIPTSFVFSPDGTRLYGSSYYTGVSNIFRYDFAHDSMDVVSNCETGFFRPLPLGGDSLIVFRYTGQGFVPARIEARPLTDVGAITYLGQRLVEEHPVLKSWIAPSPATIRLDSTAARGAPYRALGSIGLASAYPIVEGYKAAAAYGVRLNFSDPLTLHALDVSASYSGDQRLADDERWHATLGYKRYNMSAGLRYNGASFYDLFGPTKVSRKGYGANLGWSRNLVHDTPRSLDLSAGVAGYGGLERHPDFQNVATSPGFDKLLSGNVQLAYKNMRSSLGAVDYEKGWQWRLAATTNGVRFVHNDHAAWRGFPLVTGTLDVGVPLPLANSSVWLRNAAGYAPGDRNEPFANFFFGGFGNNWIDHQEPRRYRDLDRFPGVELDDIGGTNFAKALLDWNLPPLRFERLGTLALYCAHARTSLFAGGIVTNMDSDPDRRRLADVGAQTDFRLQLLTQDPLTLSFGWARAFERLRRSRDEWMVSLKVL